MAEADEHASAIPESRPVSARSEAGLSPSPSLWLRAERALGLLDDPVVTTFRSHGSQEWLRVKGRVVEARGLETPEDEEEDRSTLKDAWTAFRRFESDEIPGARIRARYEGGEWASVSDEEGYFSFRLEPEGALEPGWHEVPLEVEVPLTGDTLDARAPVLVPSDAVDFGILSDLDDTVVKTHATDTLSQIRMIFGTNAATRPPLPGVGALYRTLVSRGDGVPPRPVFYVSLSGWNLYDLFDRFMELQDLPPGPFFMQDLSIVEDDSAQIAHDAPKMERAAMLLENYPEMDLLLIGDSGQNDAETYRRVVDRHPGRILAVYIRDVSPDTHTGRDDEVEAVAREVRAKGVPMILAEDSIAMAEHACDRLGVLDDDDVAAVREEVEEARGE